MKQVWILHEFQKRFDLLPVGSVRIRDDRMIQHVYGCATDVAAPDVGADRNGFHGFMFHNRSV